MPITRLLIANRGEIAIRIARAAADLGLPRSRFIPRTTPKACICAPPMRSESCRARAPQHIWTPTRYRGGKASGCDAIHPGYGFLAERADFAASLRRGGPDLRRTHAGTSRVVRRQGAGAGRRR